MNFFSSCLFFPYSLGYLDKINNKTITGTWTSNFPGPMAQCPWPRPAGCQVPCPVEAARASGGARAAAEAGGPRGVGAARGGSASRPTTLREGRGRGVRGRGLRGQVFWPGAGGERGQRPQPPFGRGWRLQSPPRGEGEAERAATPPKGRGWRKDVRSEGQIECTKLA